MGASGIIPSNSFLLTVFKIKKFVEFVKSLFCELLFVSLVGILPKLVRACIRMTPILLLLLFLTWFSSLISLLHFKPIVFIITKYSLACTTLLVIITETFRCKTMLSIICVSLRLVGQSFIRFCNRLKLAFSIVCTIDIRVILLRKLEIGFFNISFGTIRF